jgi:TolB-like protein/class 3 adenylate cyclase/tetratricopeptide (TPR) repeat protein
MHSEDRTSENAQRVVRALLVVDVVESVILFQRDEEGTVKLWHHVLERVTREVLPATAGRLVKSLGDGMMLEFREVRPAMNAAFAIQRVFAAANTGVPPDRQMLARIGMHVGEVVVGEGDLYGHEVNLAARLTTLAGPAEIVGSAAVRDQLTDLLDADIEDLGDCYLKHVERPVRAYRFGPPGPRPVIEPDSPLVIQLRPTIAVIPFSARRTEGEQHVLGEVIADDVISALSRTSELHVISRLSTTAFRDRQATLSDIGNYLKANYVLSGAYRGSGNRVRVTVEMADVRSGRVEWTETFKANVNDILSGEDPLVHVIVSAVSAAILQRELQRARTEPLPNLQSYTLLMGAIVLMHRGSRSDFDRAGDMLEMLTDRSRRVAIPHAWLAEWHVLRFNRGRSYDAQREASVALDCTKRALDLEPNCSLALTIDGFVHTNLLKRFDLGEQRYDQALEVNPNDSLAWLLKGTLHAFKGEGEAAVESTEHALKLSPLDPLRYFYESLAATAAHSAGRYERAIELAQRSLRANRVHPSTLRALAIAQSQLGRMDDARKTVSELLKLDPALTVRRYLETNPSGAYDTGKVWSEALRRAGLPD